MPELHLTADQLAAFRDGQATDHEQAEHVRGCLVCQARLQESRLLRALLAQPESTKSPHLTPNETAAYADGGLAGADLDRVEGHLAACEQCLGDLLTIREHVGPLAAEAETPPPWVVARAIEALQPSKPLGELVVRWVAEKTQVALDFLRPRPEPSVAAGVAAGLTAGTVYWTAPLMGAAITTVAQFLGEVGAEVRQQEFTGKRPRSRRRSSTVRVLADPLTLDITAAPHANKVRLVVRVRRKPRQAAVEGAVLALHVKGVRPQNATTNARGHAEFDLPRGTSRLSIHAPIRRDLTITF